MKFKKGSVRNSLYFSILDGLFTAMMAGVSDFYLVPYGIALGATTSQVALLAGLPLVFGALLQLMSAGVTQSIGSRVKLINFVVFFHALSWLPIILIPYVFKDRPRAHWAPWALIVSVTVYSSFGAFAVPAWQSLMSDYIPVKKRGKYFGWRNKLQGTLTIIVSILTGLILYRFGKDTFTGFTLIFIFAMCCRFCAWGCLSRMTEPFRKSVHDIYFSFFNFIKQIRTSNFAKFVLFASLTSFSVNLSASLFPVFLLKELRFDYASYMVLVTTAAFSSVAFQEIWGRYGDRGGNLRVLRIAGWGIAILPALWLISQKLWFGILIQFVAGCFWGGFNLIINNFLMEAVSSEKRIRCISYFNVMNNFSVLCGAVLGGFLLHRLPLISGYSFLALFLLSCVARMLVMFLIAPKVKEVRKIN
jgi:MFS family permease